MTRLLLVRHGQSEWNATGRWQGQGDPPLSDQGRDEAAMAASTVGVFDSGLVYASPLKRAYETAKIISARIGDGVVHVEDDLSEIDVGEFSGLTSAEIEARLPDAWRALRAGELAAFPGGEARSDFRERLLRVLRAIATNHPGAEILVVTHGGAIGDLERYLDVHPGVGVANLEGRWFEMGESLAVNSERVKLAEAQPDG